MDNQKDKSIQTGNMEPIQVPSKNLDPIRFFEKNSAFVFVYKKTEKLATAVYMVSNLLSDSEPMKWTLRSKVSALLSLILTFKDAYKSEKNRLSGDVKTKVLEIVSLLEIASSSGLISQMNFSIIRQEFLNLVDFLNSVEHTENEVSDNQIKETFFDVPKNSLPVKISTPEPEITKDPIIKDNIISVPVTPVVFKKNNRQNIILTLLKKKSNLTINDMTESIKDCSSKTIQRELNSLISVGIIGKTGERRWTKYFIK